MNASARQCLVGVQAIMMVDNSYENGHMYEESEAKLEVFNELAVTTDVTTLKRLLGSGACWRRRVPVYV